MILRTGVSRRTLIRSAAGSALAIGIGMPAISCAQSDVIKIGHLTPRTGFLGPLGDYAVMGIQLAADEINAAGGVNGRKIELVLEDSVNPQTASAKAERLIERDKVAMLIGEISSASGLAIGQVAKRTKTVFINTGCNSDALRGVRLQSVHVPHRGRELDVREGGRAIPAQGEHGQRQEVVLADGRLRVRPRSAEGRQDVHGEERRPVRGRRTGPDRHLGLLAVPAEDPSGAARHRDLESSPAIRSPTSSSSIPNTGCNSPSSASRFDTAVAWGLGKGNFSGVWPLVWHHLVDTPASKAYVEKFTKKYGKPPENQSWGDYNSLKIVAQSMTEMKSTDPTSSPSISRKGAKFDVMKTREGYFRAYDNQMMHGDVRGARQGRRQDEGPVGHLRRARHRARRRATTSKSSRRRRGRATSGEVTSFLAKSSARSGCALHGARRESRLHARHDRAPIVQLIFILEQVLNGLLVGVYYLLIALGLSLIFSLGGIVNLAHGAFYAIGAYLAVLLTDRIGFVGAFIASPVLVGRHRHRDRAVSVPPFLSLGSDPLAAAHLRARDGRRAGACA